MRTPSKCVADLVIDRNLADCELRVDQERAKSAGSGLWSDPKPLPPWEWRRIKSKWGGTKPKRRYHLRWSMSTAALADGFIGMASPQ